MQEQFIEAILKIEQSVDERIEVAEEKARERMELARKEHTAVLQRARMEAANVRSEILAKAEENSRLELAQKASSGIELNIPEERLEKAKALVKERIVEALGHR